MSIGRELIFIGAVILIIGIILSIVNLSSPPRLPGDIFIKKDNFVFYFPVVTSIIISIVLSIIFYLFFRK